MTNRNRESLIIQRGNRYLMGRIADGFREFRWSIYCYDAWRTRNRAFAIRVARALGGDPVLFDFATGDRKLLDLKKLEETSE